MDVDFSEEIKGDWILLAMIALGFWSLTSSIPLILKHVEDAGPILVIPYINIYVLSYMTVLHIVMLKHALAKRLRIIRSLGKSADSVAQLISATRQVLDYNSTINVESAVFTTTVQITSIVHFINYWYVVWIIHVAGRKVIGAFENLSVLAFSGLFTIRVLMDVYSSIVTHEYTKDKGVLSLTPAHRREFFFLLQTFEKTCKFTLNRQENLTEPCEFVEDVVLEVIDATAFLAMYLDQGLTWNDHVDKVCVKVTTVDAAFSIRVPMGFDPVSMGGWAGNDTANTLTKSLTSREDTSQRVNLGLFRIPLVRPAYPCTFSEIQELLPKLCSRIHHGAVRLLRESASLVTKSIPSTRQVLYCNSNIIADSAVIATTAQFSSFVRLRDTLDYQISLFMLELHHTPVDISALGLFSINRTTLTTMCGTIIAYIMVLIQFS
ncbi:hypothetical protein J6590_074821 [Homalodisca vitripennis]|nr:hypothetical protein J6590_074821 [Homalodisca vitripennis]